VRARFTKNKSSKPQNFASFFEGITSEFFHITHIFHEPDLCMNATTVPAGIPVTCIYRRLKFIRFGNERRNLQETVEYWLNERRKLQEIFEYWLNERRKLQETFEYWLNECRNLRKTFEYWLNRI
jgi:hypothetical protein